MSLETDRWPHEKVAVICFCFALRALTRTTECAMKKQELQLLFLSTKLFICLKNNISIGFLNACSILF